MVFVVVSRFCLYSGPLCFAYSTLAKLFFIPVSNLCHHVRVSDHEWAYEITTVCSRQRSFVYNARAGAQGALPRNKKKGASEMCRRLRMSFCILGTVQGQIRESAYLPTSWNLGEVPCKFGEAKHLKVLSLSCVTIKSRLSVSG